MAEICVHRASIDNRGIRRNLVRDRKIVTLSHYGNLWVVQHALEESCITFKGNALEAIREIKIVIVQAHWKPIDRFSGEQFWINVPLLLGIPPDKRFIELAADQRYRFLFQVRRMLHSFTCDLI